MMLQTPLNELGRIFKLQARKLEKLGLTSVEDMLYYVPFRYEAYNIISKISLAQMGEVVTVQGTIVDFKNEYTRRRLTIQKVTIEDETGRIECVWFNQPYIISSLRRGEMLSVAGQIQQFGPRKTIQVRDYEVLINNLMTVHTGRMVPVYSETRGLSSKWIRNRIKYFLDQLLPNIEEYLPEAIQQEYRLLDIKQALSQIHFPKDKQEAEDARKRLSFDELLLTQLASLVRKEEWKKKKLTAPFRVDKFQEKIDTLLKSLPFELTSSQKRALSDIFKDIKGTIPMNRLLEGDVGSGKTVVAAIAMYVTHLNGFQAVLMAPTQILAEQHYNTVSKLLGPFGLRVKLFTSTTKRVTLTPRGETSGLTLKTAEGKNQETYHIAIGTHALLHKHITFDNLGLVVIDEQQRFGVEQRALLREKGDSPHFLTMTATPIPRTVLLTAFGDLDLSFLDELPMGRKKIKTWLVPNEKRTKAYEWITQKLDEKDTANQVFIVCPFIEESETQTTVKAATVEFEKLKKTVFQNQKLSLLHGKLKSKEKEEVLENFRNRKFDILVATPVVEVGIDIPGATIILIEASERFGLAQLHQLRGRVGRNDKESYCLLFTDSTSEMTTKRLTYMENTYSGAQLAEYDLKLRGAGNMYGTAQHGKNIFKIATFEDSGFVRSTEQCARKLLPQLATNKPLLDKITTYNTITISPD